MGGIKEFLEFFRVPKYGLDKIFFLTYCQQDKYACATRTVWEGGHPGLSIRQTWGTYIFSTIFTYLLQYGSTIQVRSGNRVGLNDY